MLVGLCLLLALFSPGLGEETIVKTSYGSIRGYERLSKDGVAVRIYKAVPFAAPPAGDLRWKLPEEPRIWDGVLDGTKYSAACLSNSTTSRSKADEMSEDCLYLNVFIRGDCEGECPITVFYHGGGMNYDSAVYYDDEYLVENFASKGVMLVVPAFRLGFTGIFSLGDDQEIVPSNLGVHDALQALKFVQREARVFGGNADSITLMGHSYGSNVAAILAYSPLRIQKVNISRVVMMSGGFIFDSPKKAEWLSMRMIEKAGCTNVDKVNTLACLRSKDAFELLQIQSEMEVEDKSASWSKLDTAFENFVMAPPIFPFSNFTDLFSSPPPGVDFIIGTTENEMDVPIVLQGIVSMPEAHTGRLIGAANPDGLQKIREKTATVKGEKYHTPASETFFVTAHKIAQAVNEAGKKAFVYSFDQPLYNYHTNDLSFIAGVHAKELNENEQVIARIYPAFFVNFSLTGVPSPNWTPMNANDSFFSIAVDLEKGRVPEMREWYQREVLDFWIREAPAIDRVIEESKRGEAGDPFEELINERLKFTPIDSTPPGRSLTNILLIAAGIAAFFVIVILSCRPKKSKEEETKILGA